MKKIEECVNIIKDEPFMFVTETDNEIMKEYEIDENNKICENDLFKMVKLENKSKFGIVGYKKGSCAYCEKNGSFNILGNKISFKLNNENRNLLELCKLDKIIGYRDIEEYIKSHDLTNRKKVITTYHLGYKIENDYLYSKIILNLDRTKGCSFTIEITPKKNFNADLNIYKEDKVIVNKDFKFKENVKDRIQINI